MSRGRESSRRVAAVLAAQEAQGAGAITPGKGAAAVARSQLTGTRISARLLLLTARLASTASATFARLEMGSVEAKVLFCLGDGPLTASRIGKIVGIDRAAICRAAQTLAERGLVTKAQGSLKILDLTPEGARVAGQVDLIAAEREKRLLTGFSPEERAEMLNLLGRLMLNVPELDTLAESRVFAAGNDL